MRKVAILGASSPSKWAANSLPPDWELHGMNLTHRFLTRSADRYFQMHHRNHNGDGNALWGRPPDHAEFLKTCGIPVFMQDVDSEIPTSVRYPLEDVVKRFGPYLTSTVAYMLALALYEGVDEIMLLGIYMKAGTEYAEQRPCVEYLLGAAKAMGVPVTLPAGCDLAQAPLYGYSEDVEESARLRLTAVGAL